MICSDSVKDFYIVVLILLLSITGMTLLEVVAQWQGSEASLAMFFYDAKMFPLDLLTTKYSLRLRAFPFVAS